MRNPRLENLVSSKRANPAFPLWVLATGCLLLMLIAVFAPRTKAPPSSPAAQTNQTPLAKLRSSSASPDFPVHRRPDSATESEPAKTAEQIVNDKVRQCSRKRRQLAHQIAIRMK